MNHEFRFEVKTLSPFRIVVIARCTCGLRFERPGMTETEAREGLKASVELHEKETRT